AFYSVWKKSVKVGMRYYNERSRAQGEVLDDEVYQEVCDEEETIEDLSDIIIVVSSEWDTELDRVINQERAEAVAMEPEIEDLAPDTGNTFGLIEDSESEDEPLINRKRCRKNYNFELYVKYSIQIKIYLIIGEDSSSQMYCPTPASLIIASWK
ncbi:hypothetical protein BX616_008976, partial [Lobosporangium transversale]